MHGKGRSLVTGNVSLGIVSSASAMFSLPAVLTRRLRGMEGMNLYTCCSLLASSTDSEAHKDEEPVPEPSLASVLAALTTDQLDKPELTSRQSAGVLTWHSLACSSLAGLSCVCRVPCPTVPYQHL